MHTSKQKIVVSALFGLVVTISCAEFNDTSDAASASILLNVLLWPLFSLISYLFIYLVSRYSFSVEHKRIQWVKFLLYMLPGVLVSLVYLFAFYPGTMTVDSIVQWKEAQAILAGDWSRVTNGHPAAHTALLALIISIWHSPAAVAAFQILCVSAILAYGTYSLEKAGIPQSVVWIYSIVLSICPSFGIFIITLWKDVLFSAGLTFLTIIIINIVISNGEYIKTFRGLFLLFVAMLMVLLFRHNGSYALVLSIPLILFIYGLSDSSNWKDIVRNSTVVRFYATYP
jgi:hypothetical protein